MTSTNLKSNTTFIGELETTIGSLAVFRYRVKGMIEMERYVGDRSASEINPSDYIRKLVSTTSYLLKDVIDGVEPEERASNLAVQELSLDDLDGFSSLFLEHHNYLEKERCYVTNNENGKKILSFEWGERVEHRLEGEREFEYLHRLLVLEQKSFKEQGEKNLAQAGISSTLRKQLEYTTRFNSVLDQQLKAMAPLTAASDAFPKGLAGYDNSLSKIARATDNITKPISSLLKQQKAFDAMIKPLKGIDLDGASSLSFALKQVKFPEDIVSPTNKLQPPVNITKQLQKKNIQEEQRQNRALELSEQAVEHSNQQLKVMNVMAEQITNLNQNQSVAAEDSAKSSVNSEKIARRGLAISWAVLVLTVCGLGITAFSTYMSYIDSKVDSDAVQENMVLRAEIESKSEEINNLRAQSQKVTELEEKLIEVQSQLNQKSEPKITSRENDVKESGK
ncbi:hypothetical protein OH456_12745 [Vibrio sp. La 4.2.2]|uniref:hypothetical protein n=1 Tax=Vibrio sp. La 4.2.2 TaxID=2998830 RepID=UPI0022CE231E|nr:hypothetical protein [Vibrio sp. La 4.2.2]MDA0109029.1 hypothetical protein [Vibrio sp. La 4.2.2]